MEILKWLEGKKTYCCGILLMISAVLFYFGIIDSEIFAALATVFGGGLGMAVTSAVHKNNRQSLEK